MQLTNTASYLQPDAQGGIEAIGGGAIPLILFESGVRFLQEGKPCDQDNNVSSEYRMRHGVGEST